MSWRLGGLGMVNEWSCSVRATANRHCLRTVANEAASPPGCNLQEPGYDRRVITPNMTSRGKRLAFLFGLVIAFELPKHVECGHPGGECSHPSTFYRSCTSYEVEPFGFYLIEKLVGSDVGFAYSTGEECR